MSISNPLEPLVIRRELENKRNTNRKNPVTRGTKSDRDLKWGIWAYFLLLIFEGALRKWFLPGLATPLLVIRDPLALWLVLAAYNRNKLPLNPYVIGWIAVGAVGSLTSILVGHGNLIVTAYGARILLLHCPLIFVIGRIFTRDDVLKMGRVTLVLAIPMTVLIALQFYSPQSAWVNRGVGGDLEGAGFSGALGYSRPPGTFSFTNGTGSFYTLVAPFVCYFWLEPQRIKKIVLLAATGALIVAVPLSISRGLLFQVGVCIIFTAMAISRRPKYAGKMIVAVICVLISLSLLSTTSFFGTALEAFSARFEAANENEGGMVEGVFMDRFFGGLIGSLRDSINHPLLGQGLGMGTNVGAMLLSGSVTFLIAEGEWGRMIGETGPILGLAIIGIRVSLSFSLALKSYTRLASGDLLPWLLLSVGGLAIAQGGWGQPTSLGFFTIMGGLLIASLRTPPAPKRGPKFRTNMKES